MVADFFFCQISYIEIVLCAKKWLKNRVTHANYWNYVKRVSCVTILHTFFATILCIKLASARQFNSEAWQPAQKLFACIRIKWPVFEYQFYMFKFLRLGQSLIIWNDLTEQNTIWLSLHQSARSVRACFTIVWNIHHKISFTFSGAILCKFVHGTNPLSN